MARGRTGWCSVRHPAGGAVSAALPGLREANVTPALAARRAPIGASWANTAATRVVAQRFKAPVDAETVRGDHPRGGPSAGRRRRDPYGSNERKQVE